MSGIAQPNDAIVKHLELLALMGKAYVFDQGQCSSECLWALFDLDDEDEEQEQDDNDHENGVFKDDDDTANDALEDALRLLNIDTKPKNVNPTQVSTTDSGHPIIDVGSVINVPIVQTKYHELMAVKCNQLLDTVIPWSDHVTSIGINSSDCSGRGSKGDQQSFIVHRPYNDEMTYRMVLEGCRVFAWDDYRVTDNITFVRLDEATKRLYLDVETDKS
jgi:hypothetical protein